MFMDDKVIVNVLNKYFDDKILTYKGPIIYDVPNNADIDFKVKFLGIKKLISVGEWTDYLQIQIRIINVNNDISKLFFGKHSDIDKTTQMLIGENSLWYFKQNLKNFIYEKTRYFEDIQLLIESIIVDEVEPITEQKMTRVPIRNIVRDIVNIIKKGKTGNFYLPENEYGTGYEFQNFPLEISIELIIKFSKKIETFKVNAEFSQEDDVIEVLVIINPNNIDKSLYDLIGELNEVIAHELEHSQQSFRGELSKRKSPENPLKYYTQKHELEAQLAGFKRLSKLRKQPLDKIIIDWFESHEDIHQLNDKEKNIVIKKLMGLVN